jgi:hypothetical protein
MSMSDIAKILKTDSHAYLCLSVRKVDLWVTHLDEDGCWLAPQSTTNKIFSRRTHSHSTGARPGQETHSRTFPDFSERMIVWCFLV